MPKTKAVKKTLASFKKQYGKSKGTSYFYASVNKGNFLGAKGFKAENRRIRKRR
jgi:hypothetical protein